MSFAPDPWRIYYGNVEELRFGEPSRCAIMLDAAVLGFEANRKVFVRRVSERRFEERQSVWVFDGAAPSKLTSLCAIHIAE